MIHGVKALLVTGGPSSGKSEFMERVWDTFGKRVVLVPEAPTFLLEDLEWPKPPHDGTPETVWDWQRAIYRLAHVFETVAAKQAHAAGAKLLICDRGVLDGAAYVEGDLESFGFNLNIDLVIDKALRYDRVLYFDSLAVDFPELYAQGEGNEHRLEGTAEEAAALCGRTWEVYEPHPRIERIPAGREGSAHKIERGLQIIEKMLSTA